MLFVGRRCLLKALKLVHHTEGLLSLRFFSIHCVVPENIHTPTTEGIGNSRGVGGSKAQENPEERGIEWIIYFPEGQLRFIPM